jgi:hypothetical protein
MKTSLLFDQNFDRTKTIHASITEPSLVPFGTIQFSVEEVEKILLEDPEPDGVPSNTLKTCASAFSIHLSLIFIKSLVTGVFPEKWKLAFKIPIFKDGKRNDIVQDCIEIDVTQFTNDFLEPKSSDLHGIQTRSLLL